jgi:uncharacterized membrane protein
MANFQLRPILLAVQIILGLITFWQSTNASPYNMLVSDIYGVGMLLGICLAASPIAAIIVLYVSLRDARLARREAAAAAGAAAATAADTSNATGTPSADKVNKVEKNVGFLEDSGDADPRSLFVVSARYGRSYEAVRGRSGVAEDARRINWDTREPINKFPLASQFTRHFAVCFVSRDVWRRPGLAWREAFQSATFWELVGRGVSARERDAVRWSNQKIESIDGILYVGLTNRANSAISTECKSENLCLPLIQTHQVTAPELIVYRPLKNAWQTYDPVWWNSFDYAIRLAYLLIHDETSTKNLQYLLRFFAPARSNRVDFRPALVLLVSSGIAFFAIMVLSLFFERQPEGLYLLGIGSACFLVVIGFFFAAFWTSRRAENREGPVLRRRNEELIARFEVLGTLTQGVELVRRGWK